MKFLHYPLFIVLIFFGAVFLAACGAETTLTADPSVSIEKMPANVETVQQEQNGAESPSPSYRELWVEEVPRLDDQGAVEVEIVPLNPNNPGHTLDFRVALNTHSVDLSMDLANLATLETDTGIKVQASLWDAPLGGHHVSGILSFPSGVDGKAVLEGASKMTIKLVDVDAPERVFVWER